MRFLFIDIDTLRPDHMSCYGYERQTTPNLDQLCDKGVRFNNYYCSDAPCLPSRASLISGMFGIKNGAVAHGGAVADPLNIGTRRDFTNPLDEGNLHNIFRRAGYHTASISTFPERHSAWWFNGGLKECYNVGGGGMESGEEVLPVALDWLDRKGHEDNWYLHVHLWDPHTPYRAPENFGNPFEDTPLPVRWIDDEVLEKHLNHTGPHCINEINMYTDVESPLYPRHLGSAKNHEELKKVFDGYDTGILYADYLVGQIFDRLKELGIYEDTAIILTSDHGENMGELGLYAEHATADNITCHIPFIIKYPGCAQGHVDEGLHYSLDLLPTLAELMGVDSYSHWDGESYLSSLKGEQSGRDALVLSQMAHVCQRSSRFDDYIYIRTYHDGFHLFEDEMLFDLANDPHEQNNIASEHPDLCAKGAKIILDWHDQNMKVSPSLSDPLWTVMRESPFHTWGALDGYIQRLKETGREEGAKALEQKYKHHS